MSAHDYESVWSPAAHTAAAKAAQRSAPPAVEAKPRTRREGLSARHARRARLEAMDGTISSASAKAALSLMQNHIPTAVLDGFSREQVAWVGRMLVKVQAEAIRTGRLSAQRSGEA